MENISKEDLRLVIAGWAVLFIAIVAIIAWFVHKDQKDNPTPTVAKSGIYAGWAVDNSSISGLYFRYPTSWTDVPSHSECTGAVLVSLTPSSDEIAKALPTASQYYIEVERYGSENANCRQDGTDLGNITFGSIQSSEQLQHGAFKGDWLTFFSGGNQNYTTTQADTAILTTAKYTTKTRFTNSGTLNYKGKMYQISIVTNSSTSQTSETPVAINLASFKTSELYKDTIDVFNSMQPD